MLSLVAQCATVYTVSWILWKTFRWFFVSSPLDNVPGPEPTSVLLGSEKDLRNKNAWAFHRAIAEKYGGVIKLKGLLGQDKLYVFDPKALHHILVKDQNIYQRSPFSVTVSLYTDTHIRFLGSLSRVAFGHGLLGTLGEQHRKQRKMLNPVFSIAHMREMVPIFYKITHNLRDAITKKVAEGPCEVEMMSWMTRTALELIGQSGLGFSFDSLTEEAPHPYADAMKEFVPSVFKLRFITPFLHSLCKIGSPRFRRFVVDVIPWKAVQECRDQVDLMEKTSIEIYEKRKKALSDGDEALITKVGQGRDIMSILMRANMSAEIEESLTEKELLAQMSTLIFAAMDTTSNALSRVLHLLATHPKAQDRLREELSTAREENGGHDIPYDQLVLLPYLDAICRETLRLHPSVSNLSRTAMQDVVLPLSTPVRGRDGIEMQEIHIPKGTQVMVAILAANRNPAVWGPDAEEWKPERWLEPLPETVINAHLPGIYSHLLTFLGGGNACIGFKFSQLEMKAVLFTLLENFRFLPSEKEIIWEMNGITSPNVRGSGSTVPIMPLIVERA